MKMPLSSMDQLRPSTSKSAQRLRVPAFSITVPSPRLLKSRKRQRHAASPEVDSGDSYEDMVQHQVGSNEWWLDTPDGSVRQRKNREIRRSNEVHLHQQRSPPYLVGEPALESRHQIWSDELSEYMLITIFSCCFFFFINSFFLKCVCVCVGGVNWKVFLYFSV